jgi:uncharacterized membrane protein (UPF0136 family)
MMQDTIYDITTGILIALTICIVLALFFRYVEECWSAHKSLRAQAAKRAEEGEEPLPKEKKRLSFRLPYHPLEKKDIFPVILITLVYLGIALINLGSFHDPQTFVHLTEEEPTAVVELTQETEISNLWYYTGLYSGGSVELSYSDDGESWTTLDTIFQRYNTLFKWHDLADEMSETDSITHTPSGELPISAKYLRFTLVDGTDLALGEVALYDSQGQLISSSLISGQGNGALLVDEPDQIPDTISYLNSTYFDEVYHARTAYEHLNNVYPYEDSHPPLGKLLMSLGILIFGMCPVGWRIVGTVLGAVMLPILYLFLKNLYGKTPLAVCGTLLFAYDFMHFVQTRIATIDTYSVLFVMLSFYFLYRYLVAGEEKLSRQLVFLGLCGLFFGIGAACKWTVIYAGGGLCVLYFWNLILKWMRRKKGDDFYRWLVCTLAWSVVFFLIIPGIIYTLSYLPYAKASGNSLLKEVIDNQVFMFTYHNGVDQAHPYASRWWQWILDIRPILYYSKYNADATKACIAAWSNPVVAWGGLLGEVVLLIHAIYKRSGLALFLFVAWFAELAPWLIITRTTFEYHYFGSILFLVFAIVYIMNELWEKSKGRCKGVVYGLTGYAVFLFVLFYPALSGLTVPRWYCNAFLKWFPTWPLG